MISRYSLGLQLLEWIVEGKEHAFLSSYSRGDMRRHVHDFLA